MAARMIPPAAASDFLAAHGWQGAEIRPLAGDASFRRYFRVHRGGETAVLSTCTGGIVGSIAGAQGTLLAPKFFADCLALENPKLRYACVATGVDQQTALPACAGG